MVLVVLDIMDCFRESVASMWMGALRLGGVRLEGTGDTIAEAKDQLRGTIEIVSKQIYQLEGELRNVTADIRQRRKALSRPELKRLLLGTKKRRAEVSSLQSKQTLMEAQLDALEGNEVNKTVLGTLQQSAAALREMGLQNDLMKVDTVISELEEGMNHANDVQSTLSTGMVQLDISITDEELDAELAELLGEVTTEPSPPLAENVMETPKKVEQKPEPAALPGVPEESPLLVDGMPASYGSDNDDDDGGVGERADLAQLST